MPADAFPMTEACPGCGAVLVPVDGSSGHAGASASCARLFEVTLLGLREQAGTDPAAAAAVRAADAAYDAQHPDGTPERLRAALAALGASPADDARPVLSHVPRAWRTTIADVAADLDVIDLPALVDAWAAAVAEDWAAAPTATR